MTGPYGKVTESGPVMGYPYLFAGMEQVDSSSGLYRTFARYYNPHLQRFLSEDPLGFTAGDTNFFSYAGDNPVSDSDPSGECALGPCADAAASDEGPAPTGGNNFIVEWIDFFISLFDGGGGGGHPYIRGQGFKAHTINRNTGIASDIAMRQTSDEVPGTYDLPDKVNLTTPGYLMLVSSNQRRQPEIRNNPQNTPKLGSALGNFFICGGTVTAFNPELVVGCGISIISCADLVPLGCVGVVGFCGTYAGAVATCYGAASPQSIFGPAAQQLNPEVPR